MKEGVGCLDRTEMTYKGTEEEQEQKQNGKEKALDMIEGFGDKLHPVQVCNHGTMTLRAFENSDARHFNHFI